MVRDGWYQRFQRNLGVRIPSGVGRFTGTSIQAMKDIAGSIKQMGAFKGVGNFARRWATRDAGSLYRQQVPRIPGSLDAANRSLYARRGAMGAAFLGASYAAGGPLDLGISAAGAAAGWAAAGASLPNSSIAMRRGAGVVGGLVGMSALRWMTGAG